MTGSACCPRPGWNGCSCDVGVLLAGGVTVPIYASNTAEQCEFIVRDAGAKLVIVEDGTQRDKLLPLRDHLFAVTGFVQIVGEVAGGPRASSSRSRTCAPPGVAWSASHAGELNRRADTADPASTFTIIYTSGTTGVPKGVVLTHDNLVAGVCSAIRAMGVVAGDEQYLFLPLAHVLGRELEWCGDPSRLSDRVLARDGAHQRRPGRRPTDLHGGRSAHLREVLRRRHAALAQGTRAKRQAGGLGARGRDGAHATALRRGEPAAQRLRWPTSWCCRRLRARLGLDRCRFLVSGGAPLAAEIGEFFHSIGLLICEGYGLTETMAAAHLNVMDAFRFGTVGPALDVVETKIADDGEILMRGPSVFRQYYNNPTATAESVEPDGWFHSGDIGVHRGRLPAHHRSQEGSDRDRGRQEDRAAADRERDSRRRRGWSARRWSTATSGRTASRW